MQLFWHQRDLRIPDNRGLARAAESGAVLPVFLVDGTLEDQVGPRQRAFVRLGISALEDAYRECGGDLLVRRGDPTEVLRSLVAEFDADGVVYNRHYSPWRRDRQRAVDEAVSTTAVVDRTLVDPFDLAESYENHSRFYDDWQRQPKPAPVAAPPADALAAVEDDREPPQADADFDLPPAGYRAARERYDRFLESGIETYADTRDDMAAAVDRPVGAVSRLSPYLATGMLGIREVWADATERWEGASDDARRNVQKFRSELSWREGNYHLLAHNPELPTANYRSFESPIEWENDPESVAAWKAGETGYPLVDAGMRQLATEGYIHNRPRQNVASFLTKHLLVDWRTGERYFAEHLVDYDPANNAANWQWTASTGTDSVDVRIFDPVAQMAKTT